MNFIRKKLMLKTKRYEDEDYSLDLTYITPRIIAMSYPAKGFEQIYKNPRTKVSKFFTEKHQKNYRIINLSNRTYSKKKFNDLIFNVEWEDHHPCVFTRFIKTINMACLYLIENKKDIIAVHCNAGKGRTGSLINSILFVSGDFENVLKANEFYLDKRGVCVTNPSQTTYMKYFEQFSNGKKLRCKGLELKKVILRSKNESYFKNGKFKMKFYDFSNMNLISDLKKKVLEIKKDEEGFFFAEFELRYWDGKDCRDIFFRMKKKGAFGYFQVFRVNFNLFFCEDEFLIKRNDFDKISSDVPEDFEILFIFKEKLSNLEENWKDNLEQQFKILEDIKKEIKKIKEENGKSFIF